MTTYADAVAALDAVLASGQNPRAITATRVLSGVTALTDVMRAEYLAGGGGSGTPGGTDGQIQYNNAGAFGGLATTGSGNVVRATSPTLVTPTLGAASATSFVVGSGAQAFNVQTSLHALTLPVAIKPAAPAVDAAE